MFSFSEFFQYHKIAKKLEIQVLSDISSNHLDSSTKSKMKNTTLHLYEFKFKTKTQM